MHHDSLDLTAMSSTVPLSNFGESSNSDEFDLIELLLAEQQSLTAVEKFSSLHESLVDDSPAQAKYYQDLLPATAPTPGQQYAFQVDLDSCSGCKACVVACHTMNGLDENESWRRVGTISIGDGQQSRVQHVTTACHHCEDPGCLNGCPVKAYTKDPETGIVRHLDDQCIGCKYCTMMCPYEVPQYSDRLGIVRKCDMCHQRLKVGEAPACVQSCPNEAISIGLVETGNEPDSEHRLAAGAPVSAITKPSTTYKTSHKYSVANATPQDIGIDQAAENHWPLAVMLVATQVAVGMLLAERVAAFMMWTTGSLIPIEATRINVLAALVIAGVGMNFAPLHLGQPLRAWRVFLGLRTSWLSREAIVLGKFVGLLFATVALYWLPVFGSHLPDWVSELVPVWAGSAMLLMAVVAGLVGLFSSGMIYVATKRQLWRFKRTMIRFFGTAITCGTAIAAAAMIHAGTPVSTVSLLLVTSFLTQFSKLHWEWRIHLGPTWDEDDEYDRRSRRLVEEQLANWRTDRLFCGVVSLLLLTIGALAAIFAAPGLAMIVVAASGLMMLAGELSERLLYFSSVVYDRMPGTLR
ncbi:MAG: DmsC/YnfH family molybdoenzyme membrane anchor subunit [Rubripirellula sp.]